MNYFYPIKPKYVVTTITKLRSKLFKYEDITKFYFPK